MSAVVKGAVGVAVPALGAGGTYLYFRNIEYDKPIGKILATASTGTFGKDYQPYLIDKDDDKGWWEWSFKNVFSKKDNKDLSTEFQGVNSKDKLKEACGTAYGVQTSELPPSKTEKQKYVDDIWNFCSVFYEKPKTVKEVDSALLEEGGAYKGKLGEEKKDDIVSVTFTNWNNRKFWKLKEEEFFGKGETDGKGKHEKNSEENKNIFDKLFDTKKTKRGSLQETCKVAYESDKGTGDSSVKDTDVVKFCGLKAVA